MVISSANNVECDTSIALNTTTTTKSGNSNGGAMYLFSRKGDTQVAVRSSQFVRNSFNAVSAASFGSLGNNNGGAAFYVVSSGKLRVTIANDSAICGNSATVSDSDALAAGNNNGGALYFTAVGELSLAVADSILTDNSLTSSTNAASTFNANGGAAVYTYSSAFLSAIFSSIIVSDNAVYCHDAAVFTEGKNVTDVGNFNGGALYAYSAGAANVSLTNSDLSQNDLYTPNARTSAPLGNNNGGAAMFIYAAADIAVELANVSVCSNNGYILSPTSFSRYYKLSLFHFVLIYYCAVVKTHPMRTEVPFMCCLHIKVPRLPRRRSASLPTTTFSLKTAQQLI